MFIYPKFNWVRFLVYICAHTNIFWRWFLYLVLVSFDVPSWHFFGWNQYIVRSSQINLGQGSWWTLNSILNSDILFSLNQILHSDTLIEFNMSEGNTINRGFRKLVRWYEPTTVCFRWTRWLKSFSFTLMTKVLLSKISLLPNTDVIIVYQLAVMALNSEFVPQRDILTSSVTECCDLSIICSTSTKTFVRLQLWCWFGPIYDM